MVYDDDHTTENDNVLKYIYQLKKHLEDLTLFWQGLVKTNKGDLVRITQPIAPDDFIYSQVASLKSVLSNHNFVSQIRDDEKKNIILDTYTSFLQSIEKEEFFNWDRFDAASEGFYNTLHLFLNAVEGGFGAQFTIAAQSGITSKIPVNKAEAERTPYIDVPGIFGFDKEKKKPAPTQSTSRYEPDSTFIDNGGDDY